MALTDFLFNGSPPASTTTYGSTTSSLPAWYNDYTQGLISKANAIAATPYQAYTGQRLAEPTGAQQQAWGMTSQNAQNWQQPFNQALNTTGNLQNPNNTSLTPWATGLFKGAEGAAQGITGSPGVTNNLQNAQQATQASQMPAWMASTPYMAQQQSLLNPIYGNIERLANEKLAGTESGIADRFIQGGGYGGTRMGQSLGAARRGTLADISGQQAGLANQAYNQAITAGQGDLARQLQAAQQFGQLGTSAAGIQQQQAQTLSGLGQQLGQFNQADLARQLQAAQTQGQLAQTQSGVGVQQAGALEAAGQSQQQQAQRNLDLAYQDYQRQLQYPYEQASFLNNIIRGLQIPTTQSGTQTGPASVYQPSPLSQLAAAGTGLAGLGKLFGNS